MPRFSGSNGRPAYLWSFLGIYLYPLRRQFGLLAVLLLLGIGLQLIGPLILARFIDVATAHPTAHFTAHLLAGLAVAYALIGLVTEVVAVAETYVAENLAWITTNRLRADVALHCLRLDLAFHHTHSPGELIERIDGDVTLLSNLFSRFIIVVLGNALLLVGMLAILFHLDARVGIILAVYGACCLPLLNRMGRTATPTFEATRQASADLYGFLEERLAGTEDIRASGAIPYLLRGLALVQRQRLHAERRATVMGIALWCVQSLMGTLGTTLALGLVAYLYSHGFLTLGAAYLVFAYSQRLIGPLDQLSHQASDFRRAAAGYRRLRILLTTDPAIQDKVGQIQPLPPDALSVEVKDVTFGYSTDDSVLRDVTFYLAPGKVLGLVGRTGSGKTTLARLLVRFYDPQCGVVRLGGVDLRSASNQDVRTRAALVTQDVQVFHATVRDNITVFNPRIDDEKILAAMVELGLESWYKELPRGLDTILVDGGDGLSAGQAQLLALTRAFLTDPGLIILDEASSRLDPATEALLESAIDGLLRDRSGIIIAHHLTTVTRADEIAVLENGRIIEYGTRAHLAADPASHFAQLLSTRSAEAYDANSS